MPTIRLYWHPHRPEDAADHSRRVRVAETPPLPTPDLPDPEAAMRWAEATFAAHQHERPDGFVPLVEYLDVGGGNDGR